MKNILGLGIYLSRQVQSLTTLVWILNADAGPVAGYNYVWRDSSAWADTRAWKD